MRKATEKLVEEMFVCVKEVETSKIGSNEEEVVSMYTEGNIRIPIIVSYRNDGINGTKAKICYKSTKVDNKQLFAVVATPEMMSREKGIEVLITKVLTLRNVIKGDDAVTAEGKARAEVANKLGRTCYTVNKYNRKVAEATERRIAKAARSQKKATKKAGATEAKEEAKEKKFSFSEAISNFMKHDPAEAMADLADITTHAAEQAAAQA